MKIRQHPKLEGVAIGDEVYCQPAHLLAQVSDIFPSAVCVRLPSLSLRGQLELLLTPQLWRADDIENLSVCRCCGSRGDLHVEFDSGQPYRLCDNCRAALADVSRPSNA